MAVTDADVRAIIPDTKIEDLQPFIDAATQVVGCMDCNVSFTDEQLDLIITWLAAHFAAVSDPSLSISEEKVEGSTVKVNRGNASSQTGLMSTQYGQMANTLSCGCLQEADMRRPTLNFA
jgi:hypothetical protein